MIKAMLVIGVLAAGCGCASEPTFSGPIVYVRAQGFSEDDRASLEQGAREWRHLGFDVRDPRDEASPPTEGVRLVRFEHGDPTDEYQARTLVGANRIVVSGSASLPLTLIGAHELGHYLMSDAGQHEPDPDAVMNVQPIADRWTLTDADRDFACRLANHCDWY